MRQGWRAMLGSVPSMPRDIMLPGTARPDGSGRFYIRVMNVPEFVNEVEARAPSSDVWAAYRPTTLYGTDTQFWCFLDVDDLVPQQALVRARALSDRVKEVFGVRPQPIFSANKGYHLHFEHAPIRASQAAYGTAICDLLGQEVDEQPLRNFRSMPRMPYSFNGKSLATFGEPLYCVPVDLDWDLETILDASRNIRARPISIPMTGAIGDMVSKCEAEDARLRARRKTALPASYRADLVKAAIGFTENAAANLRNKLGRTDGRRRVLQHLYIPALMHETGGDREKVLARAQAWVERTGGGWGNYRPFVESQFEYGFRPDGTMMLPMGLRKFLAQNRDLSLLNKAAA